MSLRGDNGIVHRLEAHADGHEWSVCRRLMSRAGGLDHYPGRRTHEVVTCVFCLAGIRWRNFSA